MNIIISSNSGGQTLRGSDREAHRVSKAQYVSAHEGHAVRYDSRLPWLKLHPYQKNSPVTPVSLQGGLVEQKNYG